MAEGKMCKNLSQAASEMILQNHRQLHVQYAFSVLKSPLFGCLKRVTESIFKVIISKEQAETLIISLTRKQKIVKSISACTESPYSIL
jgi:hypothetical protein